MIFLDGFAARLIRFKRPGAMHHARWMAKAIYSLKMFIFRSEFRLTKREIDSLRDFCIFVVLFYIKIWFTATSAIQAPNNDFELLKKLISYKNVDRPVAQRALKKISDHLWYLNEDLAPLALFDENVSVDVKGKMCEAIRNREDTSIVNKRHVVKGKKLEEFLGKDLSEFVSKNSLSLFKKFDLPYDFLDIDASLWSHHESYRANLDFFKNLRVVNDVAERGIALIEAYNHCQTKNEEQYQYLLRTVQEHRRLFPVCKKKI